MKPTKIMVYVTKYVSICLILAFIIVFVGDCLFQGQSMDSKFASDVASACIGMCIGGIIGHLVARVF